MKRVTFLVIALAMIVTLPALAAGPVSSGDVEVLGLNQAGVPTFVKGDLGFLDEGNRRRAAVKFLKGIVGEHFNAAGDEQLVGHRVQLDDLGQAHIRVNQRINGLPVYGAQLIVHADAVTGEVFAVNGTFAPNRGLVGTATMDAASALEIALGDAGIKGGKVLDESELAYVLDDNDQAQLAWRTLVEYVDDAGLYQADHIFADAIGGSLITRHPTVFHAKSWRTYTANNGTSLPGTLLCTNTGSCGDSVAQDAHDNASTTYDYYNVKFGRDSLNNAGLTLISTVHYSNNYNNAFWNNSQMVYGDGDGSVFSPLGGALDVVAHELTHGVTSYESNLIYQNESGALNEAMSDIFGAAAEAWSDGSVSSNTWKLGEDVYTPGTSGDALRYMNNPTQDGSSRDYYPERYTGSSDNGGVHWNSGIANLAFYLLSQGGTHPRGKTSNTVPAIGIAKAEQIFYRANTVYLTSSSNFQAARNATASAAADLYGSSSSEVDAVHEAWCAVGVPGCPGGGGGGSCPTGYTQYGGTISAGQSQVTSGASASGTLNATLTGSAPDIDLYLDRESCSWWSCSWSAVASSLSASSTESITYSASSGTYRWRVYGYSGSNITFTLCANPAL